MRVRDTVLLLPGLYDSGPDHWQSHWERAWPNARRIRQRDWDTPDRAEWVATLDDAVAGETGPLLLVAHSTACLLVVHWAATASATHVARVRGALLVAPSDPDGPAYPAGPTGWSPVPLTRLPFMSTVVASTNDEYLGLSRAQQYADAWGSRLVIVGAKGHLNSATGLGMWAEGARLLAELGCDDGPWMATESPKK